MEPRITLLDALTVEKRGEWETLSAPEVRDKLLGALSAKQLLDSIFQGKSLETAKKACSRFGSSTPPEVVIRSVEEALGIREPSKKSSAPSKKTKSNKKDKTGIPSPASSHLATTGKTSTHKSPKVSQKTIDAMYHRVLHLRGLRVVVKTLDAGGLGDVINGLKTCAIIANSDLEWQAYGKSNHNLKHRLKEDFPECRGWLPYLKSYSQEPDFVELIAAKGGGDSTEGSINEYGYPDELSNPYRRAAGFQEDQVGIMIHPELADVKGLEQLATVDFKTTELVADLKEQLQGVTQLFFGYGAGQKDAQCLKIMLDRVLFDESIKKACILLPNHSNCFEDYSTNDARRKALGQISGQEQYTFPEPIGTNIFVYIFKLKDRVIKLLLPVKPLAFADMKLLWQYADRTFTVCEGDQSLSEAISAGIPFAYHLWNPSGGGEAHKRKLFQDLLSYLKNQCGKDGEDFAAFLSECQKYMQAGFNQKHVLGIINSCQKASKCFLTCKETIALKVNIATPTLGFVKRLWVRKIVQLELCGDLQQKLADLITLEEQCPDCPKIEEILQNLAPAIEALCKQCIKDTEDPELEPNPELEPK